METTNTTRCTACNTETANNRVTKTVDGKYVDLDCYRNTCSDLGRSTITAAEAKATAKFLKAHSRLCNKYMLAIQTHAQRQKISPRRAIQTFIDVEQHISETAFKKDWTCTSLREHFKAMEETLAATGYANVQKGTVTTSSSHTNSSDGMVETRAWYFRRREHGKSLLLDRSQPIFEPKLRPAEV